MIDKAAPAFSHRQGNAHSSQWANAPGVRLQGPNTILLVTVAVLVLFVGFGDGLAYGLRDAAGIPSPWLFLFPPLAFALLLYWVGSGRILQPRWASETLLLLNLMLLGLVVQELVLRDGVYLSGYLQLTAFLVMLVVVQGTFAHAPDWLEQAFLRAVVFAHYFLCGYIIIAFAAWHLLRIDVNLITMLSGNHGLVSSYYGFRPSGFSKEPAWAALALAATYSAIYTFIPEHRRRGLVALVAASLALRSGTLLLFIAVAGLAYAVSRRTALTRIGGVYLAVAVALFLAYFSWARADNVLAGTDPSLQARTESASVAWGVIRDSFPLGVGYGNFREFAHFSSGLYSTLAQDSPFYKSDSLVLNYVAEMGVLGIIVTLWVLWDFSRGRHLAPILFVVLLLTLSGTLLMPSVLVMAAVVGLLRRPANAATEPKAGERARAHLGHVSRIEGR